MKTNLLFLLLLPIGSAPAFAVNYYVSASGNSANNGKSEAKPLLMIQQAANLTNPGDTVFVMNGSYNTTNGPILNITRSGTAAGYIVYKALKGHTPKLTAAGNVWNTVSINGSYIVFEGFEMIGNNANITYEAALKAYNDNVSGAAGPMANFNTNAISIGGPRLESKFPHHVTIRGCRVHDFPGGGIGAIQADYITFENNIVYNNAWYMMYGGSGMGILTPFNFDRSTGYKNIVRNNVCSGNKTTIPWIAEKRLSDGNGIIIDVNQHGYDVTKPTAPNGDEPFTGRTLVENNVCFNNGGSGMHAFMADHVDIINNTAYMNATVMTTYADIYAGYSKDVNLFNNVVYSRNGGKSNLNNKNVDVVYDYNVYFNGIATVTGPHDVVADPMFVNPSADMTVANFTVKSGSPAIDKGTAVAGQFSRTDILGVSRPQGTGPDRGAYEFQSQAIVTAIVESDNDRIRIMPNPIETVVTIKWMVKGKWDNRRAEIVNCLGQSVLQATLTGETTQVNTEKLAGGLYLLLIYRDDKLVNASKLVK